MKETRWISSIMSSCMCVFNFFSPPCNVNWQPRPFVVLKVISLDYISCTDYWLNLHHHAFYTVLYPLNILRTLKWDQQKCRGHLDPIFIALAIFTCLLLFVVYLLFIYVHFITYLFIRQVNNLKLLQSNSRIFKENGPLLNITWDFKAR